MSDENEDDGVEVHVQVIRGDVQDLVQGMARMLSEATGYNAVVLAVGMQGHEVNAGGAGIVVDTPAYPEVITRLRETADYMEHEFMVRSN